VVAGGQTIALSGSGTTLGLLGSGDYGTASGSAPSPTPTAPPSSSPLTLPDWWANSAPPGGDILATTRTSTPDWQAVLRVSTRLSRWCLPVGVLMYGSVARCLRRCAELAHQSGSVRVNCWVVPSV